MAISFFGLLTIISGSGIPLTVSRKVAEINATPSCNPYPTVTCGLLLALIVNALTVAVFFIFKSPLLSAFADERVEKLILITLPATFSTCVYNVIRAYFMGKKKYGAYSTTELIEEILNIVIILAVIFIFNEIDRNYALPIAFTVADVICFVIILCLFFASKGKISRPKGIKELLSSSTPITLMRLFTSLASVFTAILLPNRLVAAGMTTFEATAEFGRATGMAYPLLFAPLAVTSALSIVLLPEIAERNVKEDKDGIAHKLDKSLTVAFMISAFFFVLYSCLGVVIGRFLFKDGRAGEFVSFASSMVVPLTMCQITNTTLNSIGKEKTSFFINTIALIIMMAGLYFLPKYVGIYSLAISQTAFYMISFIASSVFLAKYRVTKLDFYKPILKISLLSVLLSLCVNLLKHALDGLSDVFILLICGGAIVLGYALIIFVSGGSKELLFIRKKTKLRLSKTRN